MERVRMTSREIATRLAIIKYFEQNDGISYFFRDDYAKVGGFRSGDVMTNAINFLTANGYVENLTVNGYCIRLRLIDNTITCPEFMLDTNLSINERGLLYMLKDINIDKKISGRYASSITGIEVKSCGKYLSGLRGKINIEEIIKNYSLSSGSIEDFHSKIKRDDNGYYYYNRREKKCIHCGETNYDKFYYNHYSVCLKCLNKCVAGSPYLVSTNLLNQSRGSARRRNFEHTITKEYIEEIYKSQNGKCAYTGLNFNYDDKKYIPTLDRIDSDKGYIEGNVCIVMNCINAMKSDLPMEEFKKMILLINNKLNI